MHIAKRILRYGTSMLVSLLALLFLVANFIPAVSAASLAQGYHSADALTAGAVVSLTQSGSNEVHTTDSSNENLILGIAVESKNAIVDLQPSGSDVRVAISGEVPVLVTDLNGDIKSGDSLIISNIAGVAMKDSDDSEAQKFIGIASQDFSKSSASAKQVTIKSNDQDKSVAVGLINVKILLSNRQNSTPRPNPFIALVEKLIGRPVGTAQLIGAVAVFITTFVFTGFLLNGAIRGAFVSIGRNPLSKPSIVSNMIRVVVIGLVILIAGIAMAYVILLI